MHIDSDNSAVVRGINHILYHGFHETKWVTHPDRDLFNTAAGILKALDAFTIGIDEWVKAHGPYGSMCVTGPVADSRMGVLITGPATILNLR